MSESYRPDRWQRVTEESANILDQIVANGMVEVNGEIGQITSTRCRDLLGRKPKVLTQTPQPDGYIRICLSLNGREYYFPAHRVIWTVLRGRIPYGMTVDHINGIKTDNRIDNLRLLSMTDNIRAAFDLGLRPVGQRHHRAKVPDSAVNEIRSRYAAGGIGLRPLAAEYGISLRQVWRYIHGIHRRDLLKATPSSGENPVTFDPPR